MEKNVHVYVAFVTASVVLSIIGFVVLHVGMNSTSNTLLFFDTTVSRISVCDTGYLLLGISLAILLYITVMLMMTKKVFKR
jgi:hypothetical protein